MQTLKAKNKFVSHPEPLKDAVFQSTGLFYKLYNNAELLEDKGFKQELLSKNSLIDVSMLESIISDVKTKLAQKETSDNKKLAEIEQIERILANENKNIITKKKFSGETVFINQKIVSPRFPFN